MTGYILNRLASAQKPGNLLYTMQYDPDSRRTTMLLGQGSRRQYQFDARGQLTTQIELNTSNAPICTILDGYDAVGNRITRNLDGTLATWTYDDKYRLTGQLKPGQSATYTMDGVGNLKTMWEGGDFPKTFTHDDADRLVTMVEGASLTTYAYTAYGALASEATGNATTAYAYSGQDQLILVTPPSGFSSTYAFDGDGLRRTAQEGNVQPTTTVWDGSDYLLLSEPGANRVVLTLDSEIVACGSKDLLTDPLGSLVKEISAGASLGTLVEMYPYGSLVKGTGTPTTPYVYIAAYGYHCDNAERDYVRARELMKKLGRWMQMDPLWSEAAAYKYGLDAPLTFVDMSGMQVHYPGPAHGIPVEPGLDDCLILMANARRAACQVFGTKKGRQCVIDCIKRCWGDTDLARFNCLREWCSKGRVKILPSSTPDCCDPDTCGSTMPGPGCPPPASTKPNTASRPASQSSGSTSPAAACRPPVRWDAPRPAKNSARAASTECPYRPQSPMAATPPMALR